MLNTFLSLLLSLQLLTGAALTAIPDPATAYLPVTVREAPVREQRLWWGLIDPELSVWFAQLPEKQDAEDERILWDWSWRGFLAALFGIPAEKEAAPDASLA